MGRLTKKFDDGYGSTDCYHSCFDCYGNECESVTLMVDKLAHYEDLEEAGRLIELPCAVGDSVYRTNKESIEPYPYAVFSESFACFVKNLWGKEFFATKEEAEAKLKELEGVKE